MFFYLVIITIHYCNKLIAPKLHGAKLKHVKICHHELTSATVIPSRYKIPSSEVFYDKYKHPSINYCISVCNVANVWNKIMYKTKKDKIFNIKTTKNIESPEL